MANDGVNMNDEERIQKLENAVSGIVVQVQQIFNMVNGLEEKLNRVLKNLDDHHGVLYGEGGKSGMLAWKEQADETLNELNLALKGYGKEPGLIAVIQNLSTKIGEWDDTRKWLMRLVIGNIIAVVLGLILISQR